VFQRLEACRCQVLPVLRGGRLVGILTPENVAEFVMFSRALRTGGRAFTSATPS
jgi:hypothetical protein